MTAIFSSTSCLALGASSYSQFVSWGQMHLFENFGKRLGKLMFSFGHHEGNADDEIGGPAFLRRSSDGSWPEQSSSWRALHSSLPPSSSYTAWSSLSTSSSSIED